jgi:serine/threonine-protein kinase ATR
MNGSSDNRIMPYAVEAAWVSSRWESLEKFVTRFNGDTTQDFNVSIAKLFSTLRHGPNKEDVSGIIREIREKISTSMNSSATASLQAAHDILLRCHVLADLEMVIGAHHRNDDDHRKTLDLLESRLNVIGAYFNDKQYILGIQRAAMELTR